MSSALSKWPAAFTKDCAGIDRQIFLLDQQAMGQAFLDELNSRPITYAEFLPTAEDLRRYTDPVRELLTDLTPPTAGRDCRWARLSSVRGSLAELRDECRRLTESALRL